MTQISDTGGLAIQGGKQSVYNLLKLGKHLTAGPCNIGKEILKNNSKTTAVVNYRLFN